MWIVIEESSASINGGKRKGFNVRTMARMEPDLPGAKVLWRRMEKRAPSEC